MEKRGLEMEKIYDRLVKLSVQRALDTQNCIEVGSLYNQVCEAPKSALREDCLFLITKRIWNMPTQAKKAA